MMEHNTDDGVHVLQRAGVVFSFLTCKKKATREEKNNTIHQQYRPISMFGRYFQNFARYGLIFRPSEFKTDSLQNIELVLIEIGTYLIYFSIGRYRFNILLEIDAGTYRPICTGIDQ